MFYYLLQQPTDIPVQEMVDFFQSAVDWGSSAALNALSFMGGISLAVYIFKK